MLRISNSTVILSSMVFLGAVLNGPASLRAAIIIQSWNLVTQAGDFVDGPGGAQAYDNTVGLPFDLTRTVQSGASHSMSVYNFDAAATGATFHFDFDHVRDGDGLTAGNPAGDYANSWGWIEFTVTEPLAYQIEGMYSLLGSNAFFMDVALRKSTQVALFFNRQSSSAQTNQVFHVGGQEGTDINILEGELSGDLPAGRYFFEYYYRTNAAVFTDSGASASGWLDFQIVPEPGMALLVTLSATMILRRRT